MISNGINKIALLYLGEDTVDLFSMDNQVELTAATYVGYSPRVNVKFNCPDSLASEFIYDESTFRLAIGQNTAEGFIDLVLIDSEFEGSSMTLQLAPSRGYLYESLFLQEELTALKFLLSILGRYFENINVEAKDQASTKMKWTSLGSTPSRLILEAASHNTEPILVGINLDGSINVRDLTFYKSNKEGYVISDSGECSIRMKSPLVGARRETLYDSYNQDFLNVNPDGKVSLASKGIYGRNLVGSKFESKNVYKGYYENNQTCLDLLGKLASECYACNVWDFNNIKLLDQVVPLANQDHSNDDYLASRLKRCIVSGMKYTYISKSNKQDGDLIKTLYMNPIQEILDVL